MTDPDATLLGAASCGDDGVIRTAQEHVEHNAAVAAVQAENDAFAAAALAARIVALSNVKLSAAG